MTMRIPRSFFRREPVTLAKALLGQRLVRVLEDGTRLAGLIVETEAYLGEVDRAAHTFGGRRTARNASMWRDGGHAYVYFTYGMHYCMNVVAQIEGTPTAVLIRAVEPVEGVETMFGHRGPAARRVTDLCSGPAKLCEALAIDRALDGVDLCESKALFIERASRGTVAHERIARGPRIGVGYAKEWATKHLRFWVKGNAHVSGNATSRRRGTTMRPSRK